MSAADAAARQQVAAAGHQLLLTTIDKFQDVLFKAGIRTTTRRTRGDDVDAACGQLAGKVLDKSRRNAERNRLLS